ncbi:hypothetical protein GA0070609_5836 [Micromonospora echinaurantiaca]|uniref:Uncharacterized protein n=1 Tax=Micromonospora echinaurantiaca TaxID=47857 RepID=A0A1C5K9L4_9ACTN|nr:hypothetical protein GA0070609_5836 [Micromonospora echinaurantiaca]
MPTSRAVGQRDVSSQRPVSTARLGDELLRPGSGARFGGPSRRPPFRRSVPAVRPGGPSRAARSRGPLSAARYEAGASSNGQPAAAENASGEEPRITPRPPQPLTAGAGRRRRPDRGGPDRLWTEQPASGAPRRVHRPSGAAATARLRQTNRANSRGSCDRRNRRCPRPPVVGDSHGPSWAEEPWFHVKRAGTRRETARVARPALTPDHQPAARCPLPAARCPLPAARCPLPAARCPLPAARYPLRTGAAAPAGRGRRDSGGMSLPQRGSATGLHAGAPLMRAARQRLDGT